MLQRDRLIPVILGLLLFAVYAAGACRSIYVGDSGELTAAVAMLGIPHPSGYPLYVLLGKLWTIILPIGSVAFRMSLFSAACAAAACAVLYVVAREITRSTWSGLFAALLLAFSPSFWGEANIQRVYALNALFLALAILLGVRWAVSRNDRLLVAAFLTCGLGAANHTFMAVCVAVLLLYAIAVDPLVLRRPRVLALSAVAFVIGLLPYLFLPLRSRMDPRLDWGNPETLKNFMKVVSRSDFWERRWYRGPADLVPIAADFLRSIPTEVTWAGLTLAILAVIVMRPWRRYVLLPLLIIAASYFAMALHGSRSDLFIWHRYYIPAYAAVALLAGAGAGMLLAGVSPRLGPAILVVPMAMFFVGFRANDRSRYRIAEDFSNTLLETVPPGSALIANDDNILFVLIYLLEAEGRRPDINLIMEGVGGASLPPLRFDPDLDPLILTHDPNWKIKELSVVPVGIAFRAWRAGRPPPALRAIKDRLEGELDDRVPKDYLTRNLIGHFHYMLGVTYEERDWLRARKEFVLAMSSAPDNDVMFYNLGLTFVRIGLFDDAVAALERSHEINPRDLVSHQPANAGDRLRATVVERDRLRAIEAKIAPSLGALPPAEYHRQMSARLAAAGEAAAARGHLLLAIERESSEIAP